MKYNACIEILSSRNKCLLKCLQTLHEFYNKKYNYPVYVYYFDDIYDSKSYRKQAFDVNPNVKFIQLPYKTPRHLSENEMFYNRQDLWYAKRKFSISRKGYLHMCNELINMWTYPNKETQKFDYVMTYDDESGYVKNLPFNPVSKMAARSEDLGALIVGQRLKDGKPHQGHLDTRVELYNFFISFLNNHNVEPKSKLLKDLLEKDSNPSYNFHFLPWADSYVIKTKMFESDLWKKWIKAVNKFGGVYKYRWGDNEIFSLFGLMHQASGIVDLQIVKKGYHDQGLFRKLQNVAPSVKKVKL